MSKKKKNPIGKRNLKKIRGGTSIGFSPHAVPVHPSPEVSAEEELLLFGGQSSINTRIVKLEVEPRDRGRKE